MAPSTLVPTDPDALLVDLQDDAKRESLLKDPEQFGAFIRNYADAVRKKDVGIAEQTKDQVKAILADWLKDNEAVLLGNTIKDVVPGVRAGYNPGLYNKRAPGAKAEQIFEDKAEFFQSIWHRASNFRDYGARMAKLSRLQEVQNSFGSTIPADGGFLIPETMRAELLEVALESSVVRPRATVIPMESLRVPIPTVDSTTNATSVFGGVIAYWTEEAAALTDTSASFGRVVLDAKKLTAYSEVPNELPQDASAFNGFISHAFPQAMAFYEDIAFMKGTGVGEPLGWIGCPATAQVAKETGQLAATITWENIAKMYARMLPSSLASAVWVADIAAFPELATMALSVGTGGSAVWLNNGVEGPPMSILGRPVTFTEKANALGTAGDISFVDLSYYLLGDRQSMMAMSSPHYKFANDITAYRVISRVDGRPWIQSAITPQNSGATLSPFVNVATRS